MARSGSYDFSVNRDEVINAAFRKIGVLGEGQTANSTAISNASQALNLMIKTWQAAGISLWKNKEIILFPQEDTVKYYLGPNGISTYSTYATLLSNYVKTEVATALAIAGTSLTVDDDTGISDGDYIGVETDGGDIHWTTVNGAPAANVVTLTTGPSTACGIDNHVYSGFAAGVQRPLEIISGFRRNSDEQDIPLSVVSLDEYRLLSGKTTEGDPTTVGVDFQLDDAIGYLWPEPDNMKTRIILVVKYPLEDFDAASDDCDFPQEWMEALVYNLATRLAPDYNRKLHNSVIEMATQTLQLAMGFDREQASVQIVPDPLSYRR